MTKKISFIIFKIIYFIDYLLNKIFKRNFLDYFKEFLEEKSYKTIYIHNRKINFFTPNSITKWRVKTLFTKEPETLEWIDGFDKKDKITFWDVGANIGLYSVYAATKFDNIDVTAFEPSTSNLRILSRNISENNLNNRIKINQLPLTDKNNKFLEMQESEFIEGYSMNTFGENLDFEGNNFVSKNKYKILGTSMDYLLENKILEIPNYIKIDVDGIEHLILKGGMNFLKEKRVKSIQVEMNEIFKEQYEEVMNIMEISNFKLKHKDHNEEMEKNPKFKKIYNYVFLKN